MRFSYKECTTVECEINISINQIVMIRIAHNKHGKPPTEVLSLKVQKYANLNNDLNNFKHQESLTLIEYTPLTTDLITIKNYIKSGAWK